MSLVQPRKLYDGGLVNPIVHPLILYSFLLDSLPRSHLSDHSFGTLLLPFSSFSLHFCCDLLGKGVVLLLNCSPGNGPQLNFIQSTCK